jgi:hypothetical protein
MAETAPNDSCCPAGSLPALTEDTGRELFGTVHELQSGLTVYSVAPPEERAGGSAATKAVIVIYDVHGCKFNSLFPF